MWFPNYGNIDEDPEQQPSNSERRAVKFRHLIGPLGGKLAAGDSHPKLVERLVDESITRSSSAPTVW